MFRSIGFLGDVLLKMWCDIIDGFDHENTERLDYEDPDHEDPYFSNSLFIRIKYYIITSIEIKSFEMYYTDSHRTNF